MENKRSRREKFIDLAEKRMNKAIKSLRLIANLSNKGNYEYTEKDVSKMIKTLNEEVRAIKAKFETGGQSADEPFKF